MAIGSKVTFRFNITNKVIAFVYESIKDMPGNNGQRVLVDRLPRDVLGIITLTLTLEEVVNGYDIDKIETSGYLIWRSNHPDAIEIILKRVENLTELFTDQATIIGYGQGWSLAEAISTGNWKVVGWDAPGNDSFWVGQAPLLTGLGV